MQFSVMTRILVSRCCQPCFLPSTVEFSLGPGGLPVRVCPLNETVAGGRRWIFKPDVACNFASEDVALSTVGCVDPSGSLVIGDTRTVCGAVPLTITCSNSQTTTPLLIDCSKSSNYLDGVRVTLVSNIPLASLVCVGDIWYAYAVILFVVLL